MHLSSRQRKKQLLTLVSNNSRNTPFSRMGMGDQLHLYRIYFPEYFDFLCQRSQTPHSPDLHLLQRRHERSRLAFLRCHRRLLFTNKVIWKKKIVEEKSCRFDMKWPNCIMFPSFWYRYVTTAMKKKTCTTCTISDDQVVKHTHLKGIDHRALEINK